LEKFNIEIVPNWINGQEVGSLNQDCLEKFNPHNGELLFKVVNANENQINNAIECAQNAFLQWSDYTSVQRGKMLFDLVDQMKLSKDQLAKCVSLETGKSYKDALGEVGGAIQLAEFFASEGMRMYGKSINSGMSNKQSFTIRMPHGVCGLIVPANTPIANIAWKTFPALICGNSIVLKSSEDTPLIANLFAQLVKSAGIPDGVFNVLHGIGASVGGAIVKDERVKLISFTGSTNVGKWIANEAGNRLARVSLELGGKNPFVVCDEADLDLAVDWAILSAFSNAGQRCAAGSRIILFSSIYDKFIEKFLAKTLKLKLGNEDDCDLGPVINKKQQERILNLILAVQADGAKVLCGGKYVNADLPENGYYISPTIVVNVPIDHSFSHTEIFGPVVSVYSVENMEEALVLANNSVYGLTSAIHTKDIDRAMWFAKRVRSGVTNINMGTYGSEPHMPFGGFGFSGNGTREPGEEAISLYSELKNISFLTRANLI
jgi:acyl-CoA reductase-like NAD-dependent aldehyde dehydrogenase